MNYNKLGGKKSWIQTDTNEKGEKALPHNGMSTNKHKMVKSQKIATLQRFTNV